MGDAISDAFPLIDLVERRPHIPRTVRADIRYRLVIYAIIHVEFTDTVVFRVDPDDSFVCRTPDIPAIRSKRIDTGNG